MRPRSFTDADLLRVARDLFLERGAGVSTSEIAKQLGVSQAALFKRFATKRALMVAALMPPLEELASLIEPRQIDDRPGYEQLLDLARSVDTLLETMFPRLGVLRASGIDMEEVFEEGHAPPVLVQRWVTGFLVALGEAGLARIKNPSAAAIALLGALHGRHELARALGSRAPETNGDYVESVVGVFWGGLAPAPDGPTSR